LGIFLRAKNKSDSVDQGAWPTDADAARLAYNVLLGGMVNDGFDPRGLTEEQVREKVRKECLRCLRLGEQVAILSTTDRTTELVTLARRCQSRGLFETALLLYATTMEHWLNDIVITLSRRRGLTKEEARQLIRDIPFRAKGTWLLRLLGSTAIKPIHLKKLDRLMQLRNEFVHFKWKEMSVDLDEQEEAKKFLATWARTLLYLSRYRDRVIYRNLRVKYDYQFSKDPRSSPRSTS
jgi:hypothetical protein